MTKSRKKARKKTGLILLVVAVVLLGINWIMYASDIAGLRIGFVCLVLGLIYLIAGFVGKD